MKNGNFVYIIFNIVIFQQGVTRDAITVFSRKRIIESRKLSTLSPWYVCVAENSLAMGNYY